MPKSYRSQSHPDLRDLEAAEQAAAAGTPPGRGGQGGGNARGASANIEYVAASTSARAQQQAQAQAQQQNNHQADDQEGVSLTNSAALGRYKSTGRDLLLGAIFKYVMWVLAIAPWKIIKGLSWLLNRWQRFVSPISYGLFYSSDAMDKSMPTVRAIIVWLWNTISLALHFVDVILIFAVINILAAAPYNNTAVAGVMGALYFVSHYLMGVTMYMEHDRQVDSPVYSGLDVLNLLRRQVDVLFFDIQLLASVIHSNIMIEGMTQMMLMGYEEARVCLHMFINSVPCAIILGVVYDAIFHLRTEIETVWQGKKAIGLVYAAFVMAILNVVDKFIRLSLADPWLHPLNEDGYPLLYMRSNAARLPRALIMDFVFRCNVQLGEQEDRLTLRPLYDKYVINARGEAKHLADGHKMYLLRKALRTFNTPANVRLNRAEKLARKVDAHIMRDQTLRETRTVHAVDASNIRAGPYLPRMLEEVLAETTGFDVLSLADNRMADEGVAAVMEGLRQNVYGLKIGDLDLSNNDVGVKGAEAVATYIMQYKCLVTLNLSGNASLAAVGVKAIAAVLNEDAVLQRLDLSGCDVGGEGAGALGAMLKGNKGLRALVLANTRLGSGGVDSICKGVAKNGTLRELDLSRCGCDDKAAGHLAQALQANNTLQQLAVGNNRITDAGAKVLADALQVNTSLHVIDLSGCPMDKSWKKLLNNTVKGAQGGMH